MFNKLFLATNRARQTRRTRAGTLGARTTTLGAILACAALAACASNPGPTRSQRDRIERVLATSPGQAQPSKIVATEIAFSRAAREKGQWSAFAEYAASGAVIHGRNGPIGAAPWLASQGPISFAPQSG